MALSIQLFPLPKRTSTLVILFQVQGERCASRLQMVANSIAWMARNLSFDETFISPFAESAFANGINTIGESKSSTIFINFAYIH